MVGVRTVTTVFAQGPLIQSHELDRAMLAAMAAGSTNRSTEAFDAHAAIFRECSRSTETCARLGAYVT